MIDNVTIRYEYDKESIREVSGPLVAIRGGPFMDFWVINTGNKHLCIRTNKIVSIECLLPDWWIVPSDKIKAGFEMSDAQFDAELKQMQKSDLGFEA